MSVINNPVGRPLYGDFDLRCPRSGQQSGCASAPSGAPLPHVQPQLAVLAEMQQSWGGCVSSKPPAGEGPCPHALAENWGHHQGGGLFGSNLLSGIFGADSPVLNLVHSVLDPIPVVGDITNKICGVVSPEYHKQHQAEKARPAQDNLAVAVAYNAES